MSDYHNLFSEYPPLVATKQELNKYISDEEIYLHYFGNFEIDVPYLSPFRTEMNPSFNFRYHPESREVKWIDFGLEPQFKDCVEYYIQMMKSSLGISCSYRKALQSIYEECVLNDNSKVDQQDVSAIRNQVATYRKNNRGMARFSKGVKFRNRYHDFEKAYYDKLDITPRELMLHFDTYPCDGIWFNKRLHHRSKPHDPLFVYMFNKDKEIWKTYRPYAQNKSLRFKSNNVENHIQGFKDLPREGKVVVITSSQKDRIPWWHAGIPSIAEHNENIITKPDVINNLKQRFRHVIANMNNDETGIRMNNQYRATYGIQAWKTPDYFFNVTDPSDLYMKKGRKTWLGAIQPILKLKDL